MFVFQVTVQAGNRQSPADAMDKAVKKAVEDAARTSNSHVAIRTLRGTYNDLTQGMTDAGMVRKLRGMYNDAVVAIERPQSSLANITPTRISASSSSGSATATVPAEAEQLMRNFSSDLVALVLHPNPATLYGAGSADDMPVWAYQLKAKYDKLVGDDNYGNADNRKAFKNALSGQLDALKVTGAQKEMVMGLFEKDSETFANSMRTLTRTQKAIDGVSLIIKNKWLDGKAQEAEIKRFFQKNESEADIRDLIALKNGSLTISQLLDRIGGKSAQDRLMVALAIDANYGENASALKPAIGYMRKETDPQFSDKQGSSIDNLKLFYQTLLNPEPGAKGIVGKKNQDTWKKMRSAGDLTDRLLNERKAATADGLLMKGAFDMSVLVGFMRAYNEGDYFKSGAFQDKVAVKDATTGATTFRYMPSMYLDAISGAGGYAPAIPLTILNDIPTMDFIYKNFKRKPEDIVNINGEMARSLAIIYSEPMGANFSAVGAATPKTRQEAAEWFVATVQTLKGNKLLDDMRQRWLDLGYRKDEPYIKLLTLYDLAMVGRQYPEMDDLRKFLNELNVRPTAWNNPQDAYNAIVEYVRNNPSTVWGMVDYYYARLAKNPETLINGMGNLLEQLRPKGVYSRINQFGANGAGYGRSDKYADNEWTSDLLNLNATAGTSTGGLGAGFTYDAYKNIVGGQNIDDRVRYEAYLQTQNLYQGQVRIYDMFAHWLDEKIVSGEATLQQITDTKELDGKMRAAGFGGNLYLSFENYSTKTKQQGETLTGNDRLHVEAIYVRNGQYFKVMVHNEGEGGKNTPWSSDLNVNGELRNYGGMVSSHQYVAEHSQWALPFGSLAVGEVRQTAKYAKLDILFSGVDAANLQNEFLSNGVALSAGNLQTINALGNGARINIQEGDKVYEVRRGADGKYEAYLATPQGGSNFGFVIGAQDRSDKLAGLYAQTVDGGKFGMATAQFNKERKNLEMGSPKIASGSLDEIAEKLKDAGVELSDSQRAAISKLKKGGEYDVSGFSVKREAKSFALYKQDQVGTIVSAGYIEYPQEKTDIYGRPYSYGQSQNMGPLGLATPKGPMGIASILTEKMYAMAMAGEQYGVARVEADAGKAGSFGVGGLINWGEAGANSPKVYMFNGAHSIKDVINTRVVVDGLMDSYCRLSGQSTIAIGNAGYKLHVYGSTKDVYPAIDLKGSYGYTPEEISSRIKEISEKIDALKTSTDASKAQQLNTLGREMLEVLNRLYQMRTGDEFNYTVNQFSIGLEAPDGTFSKFSFAKVNTQVDGASPKETLYAINMTSIRIGDDKAVSFTLGVPTEKVGSKDIKNLGGVKLDLGNVAFGVTAYDVDFKNGVGGTRFDVAWINPNYTAKFKGAGAGVTTVKGGVTGDVTLGFNLSKNATASLKFTRTHMDATDKAASLEAYSVAETVAIGTANAATWLISAGYHHARQDEFKENEFELNGTVISRTGLSGTVGISRRAYRLQDASSREYNFKVSMQTPVF